MDSEERFELGVQKTNAGFDGAAREGNGIVVLKQAGSETRLCWSCVGASEVHLSVALWHVVQASGPILTAQKHDPTQEQDSAVIGVVHQQCAALCNEQLRLGVSSSCRPAWIARPCCSNEPTLHRLGRFVVHGMPSMWSWGHQSEEASAHSILHCV